MTHEGLWNELKLQKQVKFLQDKCRKAGKRIREVEGEISIIKGIGNNSPEMKALQKRVKELEEIVKSDLKKMTINGGRCGIRTHGRKLILRKFSKLLVSASHPLFQNQWHNRIVLNIQYL